MDVVREVECLAPVDDLLISLSTILRTKRRPPNKTLEHDSAHAPPVTAKSVALPTEDLRRDIIRRTNRGVSHHATGFAPHIDLGAVADGEVDLIEGNGVAVARLAWGFEQLLVVSVFVLSVEAGAKAKVGEFDVTTAVEEDIVGLNITVAVRIEK